MGAQGKLRTVEGGYAAYCPGCGEYHVIDSRLRFDGNFENPTFSPSLRLSSSDGETYCHAFITAGQWRYLSDSRHRLKGCVAQMRDEEAVLIPE